MNTIQKMMESSDNLGVHYFSKVSFDRAVSSILIEVEEGCDINSVATDINLQLDDAVANPTKSMIAGIAKGLLGTSKIIGTLTFVIWFLATIILIVSFTMIVNERKRELAVLRICGASIRTLSEVLVVESVLVSSIGGLFGIVAASLVIFPFEGVLKRSLQLPMLLPDVGLIFLIAIGALCGSILTCGLTSVICTHKITEKDTGLILREGA
jgi:putative ABC transport system permease protein